MASQSLDQARVRPGFWDFDEAAPTFGRKLSRAAAVAGMWVLLVLSVALGWRRCVLAAVCHLPCPTCGIRRAIDLLTEGHLHASVKMHPLAVPALLSVACLIASTVWATFTTGSPMSLVRGHFGRAAIAVGLVVYAAMLALWCLRFFGYFGGPVPV